MAVPNDVEGAGTPAGPRNHQPTHAQVGTPIVATGDDAQYEDTPAFRAGFVAGYRAANEDARVWTEAFR